MGLLGEQAGGPVTVCPSLAARCYCPFHRLVATQAPIETSLASPSLAGSQALHAPGTFLSPKALKASAATCLCFARFSLQTLLFPREITPM